MTMENPAFEAVFLIEKCWQAEAATWRMWDGNCHFGRILRIPKPTKNAAELFVRLKNDGVFVGFVGIFEFKFGGFKIVTEVAVSSLFRNFAHEISNDS